MFVVRFAIGEAKASRPLDGFVPNPKLRLLDQISEVMRFKHYSIRTERSYRDWIKRYILFHAKRHPRTMGAPEVSQFLSDLAVERRVAASTQNQAFNALLFLYRDVLRQELGQLHIIERAQRPQWLPTVLTRTEVEGILSGMSGTHQLMAKLLYGTGMRLMECVRLRVKALEFEKNQIIVRGGKGFKDRVTVRGKVHRPFRANRFENGVCPDQRLSASGLGYALLAFQAKVRRAFTAVCTTGFLFPSSFILASAGWREFTHSVGILRQPAKTQRSR